MSILDDVRNFLSHVNQPTQAVSQPQTSIQRKQIGWNDSPDGKGYVPVFNTDKITPKYHYQPQPKPSQVVSNNTINSVQTNSPIPTQIQTQTYGTSAKARTLKPSADVVTAINNAAKAFNVPANLLFDIAAQESAFNPANANTTPEGIKAGTPTGLFQFTPDTWSGLVNPTGQGSYGQGLRPYLQSQSNLDRTNPNVNAMAAAYLISHGQASRWNDSQFSWGPTLTQQDATPYYSQSMQYMPNANWKQ